ncbi:MAG: 50S ribosomal protein L11 methyltransferase [Polyangiaceae bacterium]|nr:50S ribosomal protein L11 methyltransferase [Polyangiaceae bacterium]
MTEPTLELAVHVPAGLADLVTAWLFEAGAGGVEERAVETEDQVALVVYSTDLAELAAIEAHLFAERTALDARGEATEPFRLERGTVTVDWEREWLRHVRPVPLGNDHVAQPVDDPTPLPRGRRALRFRPAWAFGDGTHPTTQLAAAAVERAVRARPGATVLDVGTGSAILALVARSAGAGRVTGIEVDPKAVAAALENVGLNPELEPIIISAVPLADIAGPFDLVVANITETTLFDFADDLARLTAPAGILLLTGLVAGDTERLETRLARHGLRRVAIMEQAEWVLLEMER